MGKKNENQKLKEEAKKNEKKATTQESLLFVDCYDNGVIQTKTGCFTKAFSFNDISFTSLDDDAQDVIYERYMEFLNALSPEVDTQITFINSREDSDFLLNNISPTLVGDDTDKYRSAYTESLKLAIGNNHSNMITNKYITISIYESNTDKAMKKLDDISISIEQNLSAIKGVEINPLTLPERLEMLDRIYKGTNPNYWFEHDADGKVSVDFKKLHKQGLNTKDLISPNDLSFDYDSFKIEGRYGQSLYLSQLPNFLNTNFLKELCTQPFESIITIYINQISQVEAINRLHNTEMLVENEVTDKQDRAASNNRSAYIPHDLAMAQDTVKDLQDDIMNRDQKAFNVGVKICHFAESSDKIKEQKTIIRHCAQKYNSDFSHYMYQQERGFNSVIPWGVNEPNDTRILTTEILAVLMPFDEIRQYEKGGFYYGINKTNNSVIVYNRKGKQNMNGLVLGSAGSGKSMNCKEEIINAFFNTKDDIIIIDPDREYTALAKALHGEIIKIAPNNGTYLNPFDLDIDTTFDPETNPLVDKIDYVCGLVETMLGGQPLSPKQKAILDRCIRQIYRPYLEYLNETGMTISRKECPTFQNLFTALSETGDMIAAEMAQIIEPYVTGNYNSFSKRTNVDIENRFIVFDIFNIGTNMKELGLKVCTSHLWNCIVANRRKKKYTWSYIDEFHMLLSSPLVSEFVKMIWKRGRKFNSIPCGITQNVEDLLQSPAARAIINNSYYKCIMAQSAMDTSMLRELCTLSETDIKYITGVKPGHGLICTDEFHVGFKRNMPKENVCYDLLNTTMKEEEANKGA